ncbi:hypothetical protein FisN_16Lh062 [Fistulifera solaris]|uniref:Uncharacterized protein n=1 Tax=Fistulifera solaris TaxID=1519565 RepID=A0A1Z5KIX1_FISSO|nr:hypothetical protein FisN_16Lh062 [Fistulifera solaris]|eukprot:GAX26233.1 hypothetical protein FisN_16Lh062 [Fistulifera solaris]
MTPSKVSSTSPVKVIDSATALLLKCRDNDWDEVLRILQERPSLALVSIAMENSVKTTALHQTIVSKGDVEKRTTVITTILQQTPAAARLRNGYGSLPLHVIAQRNTKLTSSIKEELMTLLVHANPDALLEAGGPGGRTPLHISFTDYLSPELTQLMVGKGKGACFMTDKKGYLPAHIACSRHCSPLKLQMLLDVNPAALQQTTKAGFTLLSLATSTATATHPNYRLIEYVQSVLKQAGIIETPVVAPVVTVPESPPVLSLESRKRRAKSSNPARKRQRHSPEHPASLLLHFSRTAVDLPEPDVVISMAV